METNNPNFLILTEVKIATSGCWSYHTSVNPLDQACDPAQKADVAAVVMQEGLANMMLVTPAMTLLRAKVEVTIPRKRRGSCTQHEKVGCLSVIAQN